MSADARLFSVLSRDALRGLADTFDIPVGDRRSAASLRDGLLAGALSVEDALPELSMPALRAACVAAGVMAARSRADTEARLRATLMRPSLERASLERAALGRASAAEPPAPQRASTPARPAPATAPPATAAPSPQRASTPARPAPATPAPATAAPATAPPATAAPAPQRASTPARPAPASAAPATAAPATAASAPTRAPAAHPAPSPSERASRSAQGRTRRPFVALDFETADNGRDSACQVAAIRVEDGAVVSRAVHLVRPPRRTFAFTWVHGITWEHVRREATFAELWPQLAPLFDGAAFVAAHNASFDRSVLDACCAAAGFSPPRVPFLCTVKLARDRWALRPTKLPDVCRHLGIPLRHHDAASDAEACARIVMAAEADRAPA